MSHHRRSQKPKVHLHQFPKKPPNPFIKLKTAQLKSGERQVKDHLRSEERTRRRHTVDVHKGFLRSAATNQDMCSLWDERGTYGILSDIRRLSVDLSPWEPLSLDRLDNEYRGLVDFDYCDRVAQLSPEEDPVDLDMLQRRVFLERRNRYKKAPPPVAKKPPNPFIPKVQLDRETQPLRRELPSERTNPWDNAANFKQDRDTGDHTDSYKTVSELVKETIKRSQGPVRTEVAKTQDRVAEQNPSVKVSQMKNAFDNPKKSKERPQESHSSPKKAKEAHPGQGTGFEDVGGIKMAVTMELRTLWRVLEKSFQTA
ncbi:uncharacterized protein LOC133413601 [Phycodurus eques]|uniref:uncharacterized protein LOC133413601 n=1 Tax=Phycodurus eques TaxID=693459 RepID=UPI002ACDE365|nr:uncharacterized protein LOC133413601 [Phycodurus eques]